MTHQLDEVIVAISDPTRRAIMARLARGPATVSDVAQPFSMSLRRLQARKGVGACPARKTDASWPREHTPVDRRTCPQRSAVDQQVRALLGWPPESPRAVLRSKTGETKIKLIDITVARTVPASAESVFDVWMDAKSPGGPWFGAERTILNPVVDGLFYLAVMHEGRRWPHYGRFLRIERPHQVDCTWVSEATKGVESIVAVTFDSRGDQTEVTLIHSGVPDDEVGRQHVAGWTWVLSMLAERFVSLAS